LDLQAVAGGFWLANSLNRSAMNAADPQKAAAPSNATNSQTKQEPELTDDEIKAKIAEADKNPTNFFFQKQLGTALYQYAAMKQNAGILVDAARILDRAVSLRRSCFLR